VRPERGPLHYFPKREKEQVAWGKKENAASFIERKALKLIGPSSWGGGGEFLFGGKNSSPLQAGKKKILGAKYLHFP